MAIMAIDTKDVMGNESVDTVKNVIEHGNKQYKSLSKTDL